MTGPVGVTSAEVPRLILSGPSWTTCRSGTNHIARTVDHTDRARCGSGDPGFLDNHICLGAPGQTTCVRQMVAPAPARAFALLPLGLCPHRPLLPGILRHYKARIRYCLLQEAFCDPPSLKCHLCSLGLLLPLSGHAVMATPASGCCSSWVHVSSLP